MKPHQSFLLHIRPQSFAAESAAFLNTYYLGFFSVFFLVLECVTGAVLMVYYVPTPEAAYESIVRLGTEVAFGAMIRDLHRLGGEGMIVVLLLHMLRVFSSGSYRGPFAFTWVTGVLLLVCTLGLAFSGYLLPWDQLAYWAVTIGTSMVDTIPGIGVDLGVLLRGGVEFGADGLLRFYLLHIAVLPLVALLLLAVHYYRVARLHGIAPPLSPRGPTDQEKAKRRLFPDRLLLDLTLSMSALAVLVVVVTTFYDAPLEHHADPRHTPAHTRAPWFFLWLQGALKLGDSFSMGVLFPLFCLLGLLALPYVDRLPRRPLRQRPLALPLLVGGVLLFIGLSVLGLPRYGVAVNPVAALLEEVAPEEGRSALHSLRFDTLRQGVYEIDGTFRAQRDDDFAWWLHGLGQATAGLGAHGYLEPRSVVVVEDWQAELKRITVRMHWLDGSEERRPASAEKVIYLHRDTAEPVVPGKEGGA